MSDPVIRLQGVWKILRHAGRGCDAGDHAGGPHQSADARAVRMRGRHSGLLVRSAARRGILRHGTIRFRGSRPWCAYQSADRADFRSHRSAGTGRAGARRRRVEEAARCPDRHGVPARGTVSAPHGPGQRRVPATGAGPAQIEALGGLPTLASALSISTVTRTASPASYRAACSNGSGSPGRSRRTPRFC